MSKLWSRSNFFVNGEVGNRLNGIRETEIYKYSANKLTNWYITETGNLKAAKKYNAISLVSDEILEVIDTRYHFFVVVTSKEIVSFNKTTKTAISRLAHGNYTHETNVSVFENQIFTSTENTATGGYWNNVFSFDTSGLLGVSNYLDTILTPVKDREKVGVDIYKVYKRPDGTMTLEKLKVFDDFTVSTTIAADGGIFIKGTNVRVERLYHTYKSTITYDQLVTNLSGQQVIGEGSTIGVMHSYYEHGYTGATKNYVIGNEIVKVTGDYYDYVMQDLFSTEILKPPASAVNLSGSLEYGEIVPLSSDIVDVAVIQNRLAMIKNDVIYFSKTFDYNNFRNGTKNDDGFYIKPSPIRKQQTKLLKMTAGNILFVSSNKGIYAIGMDTTLTPANSVGITRIVSDTPSSKEIEIINNDLYYLSEDKNLYCTQLFYTSGQAQMNNAIVEKYDITKRIKSISVGIIDNKTVLIATTDENIILIYSSLDINIFRKYSLEFLGDKKVFGFNKDLVSDKSYHEITENNFKNTEIVLNPPAFSTQKSGSYLNDYQSRIERVVLNVLNQDREAIKSVKINDNALNNLGNTTEDYFSLYKYEGKITLIEGFSIKIETFENNKILEIRGIDTLVNVAGD